MLLLMEASMIPFRKPSLMMNDVLLCASRYFWWGTEEIMNNNILSLYSNSWADKTVKKCWIQCGKKNSNRSVDNLFVEN